MDHLALMQAPTDDERGRLAARTLWQHWDERPRPIIDDPLTDEFACAALQELELLERDMPGVLRDVVRYSEAGAEQLTIDPFHGVLEVVQNADDLQATEVRVAVRRGTPGELLMWHNGGRVTLPNVLAMTFAFLSTKREDPRTKGRFGVGLKTLNQLGDELLVHSPPYHFKVERGSLRAIEATKSFKAFYGARSPVGTRARRREAGGAASRDRETATGR